MDNYMEHYSIRGGFVNQSPNAEISVVLLVGCLCLIAMIMIMAVKEARYKD